MEKEDFLTAYMVIGASTVLSVLLMYFVPQDGILTIVFLGNGAVCAMVGAVYLKRLRRHWKKTDPGAYSHSFAPWGGSWQLWVDPSYDYRPGARELIAAWRRLGMIQTSSMVVVFAFMVLYNGVLKR